MSADVPDLASVTIAADQIPRWTPQELAPRLREILTNRDLIGWRSVLAPTTALRSPFVSEAKFRFNNRDEVCYAMWAMFDFTEKLTVTHELVGDDVAAIQFEFVLGRRPVAAILFFYLADDGRIDLIDLVIRGAVSLSRFGRAISWRMGRPRTRLTFVGVYAPPTIATWVMQVLDFMAGVLFSRTIPPSAPDVMSLPKPHVPDPH